MARCVVWVLGRFEVQVDGRPVAADAWRSRRAADLVKVLALAPSQTMHREQVMALLWPDLGEAATAANLRKAVHYARRALGAEDAVQSESGLLCLWGGLAEVDAVRFLSVAEAALRDADPGACARAAELYSGDILPADRFEPWAVEHRQRLRDRLFDVLKGAGAWQRILELDPTDEQSHRELMRAYLHAGQRRDAIRQFERLRDALREHVGVAPDPQTIGLYEQVLAAEGVQPPSAEQQAAVLIATGLVHLNRQEFGPAERLAREARATAIDAGLPHELGDASTLLALVASRTGRWYHVFKEEFAASLNVPRQLSLATYDGHLCFAEYHLGGAVPGPDPTTYARELLALADAADSTAGRGMAQLMIGEAHLASGEHDQARMWLHRAARNNLEAQATSGLCITLERLAQTEAAVHNLAQASEHLHRARAIATTSTLRSHLLVRLFSVAIQAAPDLQQAMSGLHVAEQTLATASKVCEPCSMDFRVRAATICAHSGDLPRARRYLSDAERIASLWQGGPWTAAVWETRAALRAAEGHHDRAAALLREAAEEYARAGRRPDENRCRTALVESLRPQKHQHQSGS